MMFIATSTYRDFRRPQGIDEGARPPTGSVRMTEYGCKARIIHFVNHKCNPFLMSLNLQGMPAA
jgi:hypothetical protein